MAKGYSLDALVSQLYDMIYPVGICIDFANAVNPNNAFPGTTWAQIMDGRAVRTATTNVVGTSVGQIGSLYGADEIALLRVNIPAHAHPMEHTHDMSHNHDDILTTAEGSHTHWIEGDTYWNGDHAHATGIGNTGAGAYASAGYNAVFGNANTSTAGSHQHHIAFASAAAGVHQHWVSTPQRWQQTAGVTNGVWTGNDGSGTSFSITNKSRAYARWLRTA